MRILIAIDKFKGSFSAAVGTAALARALSRHFPDADIDACPIADGGEGTTEAVVTAAGGEWIPLLVRDAIGRPVTARYGWLPGQRAVMEMSAASGLALVLDQPLDPERANTFGTGQMVKQAIQRGAQRLLVGLGGSATNDAGTGLALALGYRFFDSIGREVADLPRNLLEVATLRRPNAAHWPVIEVACDVTNPLLGPHGATRVYGPQKGLAGDSLDRMELRLAHLADLVHRDLGIDPRAIPGAGAAGGLGFGLMAFCNAHLVSGFDLIAELVNLRQRISAADLIITGEGRLDAQTLCGKGPVGVARLARAAAKPIVGIAGGIEAGVGLEAEFDLLAATKPDSLPLADAIRLGTQLLEETVERIAKPLQLLLPG